MSVPLVAPGGRVKKEIEECQKDTDVSGVFAELKRPTDLTSLRGILKGPPGTPYENGVFYLDINIPPKYPFEPPKIQFDTRIWHPNISSQTGVICLDILKDQWSPALTIKTALLSILALLSAAEPNDPQDAEVAKMYLKNRQEFNHTARFWTETYAKQQRHTNDDTEAVTRLIEMGFPRDQVEKALKETQGDENAAIEKLVQ